MNLGSRTVACDGRLYYFRRRQANEGIREVTDRHIARGWLVHSHTAGEIEVYRVAENCPRYVREPTSGARYMADLVKDAADAAADERFRDFREIAFDLARLLKAGDYSEPHYGRNLFAECMTAIERAAARKNGDPMLGEKVRQAMRDIVLEDFKAREGLSN